MLLVPNVPLTEGADERRTLASYLRVGQDAIRSAIADRRGYAHWDVDDIGWVVELLSPERQDFHGGTLEEALAWCLVWLMVDELGVGPPA